MATTFAAIRDAQAALIVAATPTVRSDIAFRQHLGESPYLDWVQANPNGCMRRFYIRNEFDIDIGATSDGSLEWWKQTETVFVSYPAQFALYGAQNDLDAEDFVESDMRLIDSTIGQNGLANHVSGQHVGVLVSTAIERGAGVWTLAITFRIEYDRST